MCQYTNGKWFSVCVAHKTALKTNSFDEKPVFDCTKWGLYSLVQSCEI